MEMDETAGSSTRTQEHARRSDPQIPPRPDAQLGVWLRRISLLAEEYDQTEIHQDLAAVADSRRRPVFRVAVIGERGRGKSALVNALADRDILPVGLASPDVPVTLASGSPERIIGSLSDGRGEEHAVEESTWEAVTSQSPESIRVEISGGWPSGELEVVDIPGDWIGRGQERRRLISSSDAVLLVVSALSPVSRSELGQLEAVLKQHVRPVIAVLTMSDLVDAEERTGAVDYVRERLIATEASVRMVLAPRPGEELNRAAVRDLAEDLARLAADTGWPQRRRRIVDQLLDRCSELRTVARNGLDHAESVRQTSAAEAATAVDELDRRTAEWERMQVELTARKVVLAERVRVQLLHERTELIDMLRLELNRAPFPRDWWEKDLPLLWRRQAGTWVSRCERTILNGLAADGNWLDAEIGRRIPAPRPTPRPGGLALRADIPVSAEPPQRTGWFRLAPRLGAQGGAILGSLAAAVRQTRPSHRVVFSTAGSLVGGVVADAVVQSVIEQHRREVDALMVRTLSEAAVALADQVTDELTRVYAMVFDHLRDQHLNWHQAGTEAIDAAADRAVSEASGPDWRELDQQVSRLAEEICFVRESEETDR